MPAAAAKTTSEVDKANDCLKTEVLYKGKPGEGAAQTRAIVPLEPIRAAVHGLIAQRLENATGRRVRRDNMGCCAGMPPALAERLEGVVEKVAAAKTSALLTKTAAVPHLSMKQKIGRALARKKRIAMFVALALGGSLAAMGGWIGLRALLRKKRQAQMAADVARGRSPADAKADMDRDLAEQDEDLKQAAAVAQARQVDINAADDDDDDEDAGAGAGPAFRGGRSNAQMRGDVDGFSFKKLARGVFMPHTLVTDRFRKGGGPSPRARMMAARRREQAARERGDAAAAEQEAAAAEQAATEAEQAAREGGGPGDQAADSADVQGWNPFKKLLERHAAKVVPGGGATVAVAKMTQKKNPKLSKSAFRLFKARKGDPKAKKEIAVVRKMAAQPGNPKAKAELARLHKANKMAIKLERPKSLFQHGIV